MNKSHLKKCLHILDSVEIMDLTLEELILKLQQELILQDISLSKDKISHFIQECIDCGNIKIMEHGYDLSQPLTIFAKSRNGSDAEALAIFESCIRKAENRLIIEPLIKRTFKRKDLEKAFLFPVFIELMLESPLLIKQEQLLMFNPIYQKDYEWILSEVKQNVICSDCLKTYFTSELYELKKLQYRNTELKMIEYAHQSRMLEIIPQRGIPQDRDASKELQSFFKDCLFHEFNHQCCLCSVHIPQMLIASHIKPFRDCAHIVEAMDQNNGLLLCRNHDFLFDQGYVSFDEEGRLLLCEDIKNEAEAYQLDKNFQLKKKYLSNNRKAFLRYHRNTYFKN